MCPELQERPSLAQQMQMKSHFSPAHTLASVKAKKKKSQQQAERKWGNIFGLLFCKSVELKGCSNLHLKGLYSDIGVYVVMVEDLVTMKATRYDDSHHDQILQ